MAKVKVLVNGVATDVEESKPGLLGELGYKYASTAPATPTAPTGNSYLIKSGDTLSAIAKTQGTTIADLMKINPDITNPNLIIAGKSLTLPGGMTGGSGVQDYSKVTNIPEAQKAINEGQQEAMNSKTADTEPPIRKTTEDIIKEITTSVTPTTPKPATQDLSSAFLNYRTQYGVSDMETQLDSLRAQEQDIYARQNTRAAAERAKPVAMNVIEGRISEEQRQENEALSTVQRSITNLTNQLNTKYNVINTLMDLKKTDYNSAVADYDKQMSNNISMYNAAKNVEEADKTEQERLSDNARSNAQIILKSYADAGIKWDTISPTEQTTLTKLSLQAGFGANFFANVLKGSNGKAPRYEVLSPDGTQISYMYDDGSSKVFPTGLPAKTTSTTQIQEEKEIANFRSDAADLQTKMSSFTIKWKEAWNFLHTKYPNASVETIDNTLGLDYREKYDVKPSITK